MTEFGKIIKEQRTKLHITLEDIGTVIGVNRSTVSRYEKGEILTIGADKILQLSRILQVDPVKILEAIEKDIANK